jgi:hypothetical protein
MTLVWPVVALSGGPLTVWLYYRNREGAEPFPVAVAAATCHCGAGCTLGDLIAETLAFLFPGMLVWFGLPVRTADLRRLDSGFCGSFRAGNHFPYCSIAPAGRACSGIGPRSIL